MLRTTTLLFLLTLSISANCQVDISFNNLKKVDSKDDFINLFVLNGFELIEDEDGLTTLAFDIRGNGAAVWAYYYDYEYQKRFEILIADIEYHRNAGNSLYDNLVSEIKKCQFSRNVIMYKPTRVYLLYSCPTSLYEGRIGFSLVTEDGMKIGRIGNFPKLFLDVVDPD